jgi:hypothetical protein
VFFRPPIVLALTGFLEVAAGAACGDRKRSEAARKSPLETAIARDLTAKLAQPVTATCGAMAGIPTKCEAVLADGTKLPIALASAGKDYEWRVDGLLIETAPVVQYVNATLADLEVAQQAQCGSRFAFVEPGGRLGCKLSGGGMAFVRFAKDGTAALELDIDPASGSARGELVTPERDRELTAISKALENLEGESDGEEETAPVVPDGGAGKP